MGAEQQGQGQGDQQQSGSQGADQSGANAGGAGESLLDGEAAHQQQSGQEGQGGNDGSGNDGETGGAGNGTVDVAAITAAVTAALEARFDSIADRRVNALVKAQKKANEKPADTGDQGQQQAAPEATGPSTADVREARAEYRDAVGDTITFLGTEERSVASDLAASLIQGRLTAGEDPSAAGIAVAGDVSVRIKALRKHYEDKTIAALRRKGLLPADGRGDGQPPKNDANPGGESGFKAGADKAAEMFAGRVKQ